MTWQARTVVPVFVSAVAAAPARAAGSLELTPDLWVTGILLVCFVAIIFPLNSLIFQPLLRVMAEREDRIDGARTRATQVQEQAEEALGRYEESIRTAHEEVTAARREKLDAARNEMQSITRDAKDAAAGELSRNREEIGASLEEARQTLRSSANELAQVAAERILGRSVS